MWVQENMCESEKRGRAVSFNVHPSIIYSIQDCNEFLFPFRIQLYTKAKMAGLPTTIIRDAGKTQVASGTHTVFAVAGEAQDVDKITGHLSLL
jgi:peptidyl-tRNA hydrolase